MAQCFVFVFCLFVFACLFLLVHNCTMQIVLPFKQLHQHNKSYVRYLGVMYLKRDFFLMNSVMNLHKERTERHILIYFLPFNQCVDHITY